MADKVEDDDWRARSVVCPHCAGSNPPRAAMCRHCMGPLTSMVNTDPMGSILTRGDVFSKAAGQPTKPIVLIGMWLIFGWPLALLGLMLVMALLGDLKAGLGGFMCLLVPSVFSVIVLRRTTRNYLRYRRKAKREGEE